MKKEKNKKYTLSKRKPLMTKPADVYYDGKKLDNRDKNNFSND